MAGSAETAERDGSPESAADLQAIVFAPITGAGLVQQTIRRLTEAINVGLLTEGDRLPSETQLSSQLGISPMTLREGLATLRNAGYIETRRGRGGGNFIRHPDPSLRPSELPASIDLDYLYDIADYRKAIAGEAAALAAARASDAQLDELARQVEAIAATSAYLDYARLDAQFRIGVAAASGSKRLWKEQTVIEMELNGIVLANPKRVSAKQLAALRRDHAALLRELRAHNPEGARALVEADVADAADALVALLFGGRRRTRPA